MCKLDESSPMDYYAAMAQGAPLAVVETPDFVAKSAVERA
jgi:hypothetical protein